MALVVKDRAKETTATTGTGTVTLAGAADGFQAFSVIGNGNTTYYAIVGGNEWEVGLGTYTASGTTLSRDTVLSSSNSDSLVNFSSGDKDVFATYPSDKAVFKDASGNINLGDNDKAQFGAGNDLQIYHDGSGSYIDEQGTGGLQIRGTELYLRASSNERYIKCISDGSVTLYHNDAEKLETTSTGIDVTGNLSTDTINDYSTNRFFRRQHKANATVGGGWMSVANCVSGRYSGEVIVTDADSADHGYIRIHWMRSYKDSNFTVINTGGHANRITGARVLYQTSDDTYGEKILQVYVTTSSNYEVNIYELGDIDDYGCPSVVTPVIENSKTGYAVHGNQLEGLDTCGFAAEEGIKAGGVIISGSSCVLEYLTTPCDGVAVQSYYGSITPQNVTAVQLSSSTATTRINGSEITYRPPPGTTKVIYRFSATWAPQDGSDQINHNRFYIDGTEVTQARTTMGFYRGGIGTFEYAIDCNTTANSAYGRFSSWTSNKTLKLTARHYSTSYDTYYHLNRYWDGGGSTSSFHRPTLTIIAIKDD